MDGPSWTIEWAAVPAAMPATIPSPNGINLSGPAPLTPVLTAGWPPMMLDALNVTTGVSSATSPRATVADAVAKSFADQRQKLRDWQEAIKNMPQVQSIKASARQVAMNKVGLLKQRLEAIKALLRLASPEMAKALARELKSIASELASIARSVGTGSGGSGGTAIAQPTGASSGDAASAESGGADSHGGEAAAATDAASSTAMQAAGNGATGPANGDVNAGASAKTAANPASAAASPGDDDGAIKAMLREAKKLLKEVIGLMKAKLAHADHDAKRDLQSAEKSLGTLETALDQADGGAVYTSLGETSGDTASLQVSGTLVDLTA